MQKLYTLFLLLFLSFNAHAQLTNVLTALSDPRDILLDGSILYYAERDANRIRKIDLDDPNPIFENVYFGAPAVNGLALKGNELYFSQLNGQNKISKIDLTDPNPTPEIVLENFNSAFDMVFYGDDLYIAQFGPDKIVKIDTSVPNPTIEEVITGYETPYALELVGDVLYVVGWAEDKVSKIDLTNPNPVIVDVITNLDLPVGLAHRGNELYIAEAGSSINQDRISRIDLSNPVRETVVDGLYNPTQGAVIYNDGLYFTQDFTLDRFQLPPLAIDDFYLESVVAYPNPANDFVQISGLTRAVDYAIHNIYGAVIEEGVIEIDQNIEVQQLATGTYFLMLDDVEIIKLIKE